jgi:hypothetical protein
MDPEHVRLAMFRSPGDDSPHAERGPLPDAENPWLTDGGSAHVPAGRRAARPDPLPVRSDEYRDVRCPDCRHLLYLGDMDGGFCRLCLCTEHRAPAARSLQEAA